MHTLRRLLCLCACLGWTLLCPAQVAAFDKDNPDDYGGQSHSKSSGGGGNNWIIPALVVGAAALFAINRHLQAEKSQQRDDSEGVEQLLKTGPQLPAQFNGSAFGIRALIRGGWPIVVDYEQQRSAQVRLRLSVPGTEILTYRLDQFGLGRHLLRFDLPPSLGDGLKPAVVALTAADRLGGEDTVDGFTLHGIGIGPRAVGSIAIDRLEFAPGTLRTGRGDRADFAFHSRSTFDNAAVEYVRVTQSTDGARKRFVNGQEIGSVDEGSRYESAAHQRWDGRDRKQRLSRGRHQLQVRVWDDGGDWVGAWSDSLVDVR